MANTERLDISKITEKSPYQDITPGNSVYGGGGAVTFNTGEWRTMTPVIDWDKCKQCLLCAPMCPDSSIPVKDGKLTLEIFLDTNNGNWGNFDDVELYKVK